MQSNGFRAGLFGTFFTVFTAEVDDGHAGSICLFLEFRVAEQRLHELRCTGTDPACLAAVIGAIIAAELDHGLVVLWHMLKDGHIALAGKVARMEW